MPCEQAIVPFAHHQVDGGIGIEGDELLQQRGGQHGIAQEGGLDHQESLHRGQGRSAGKGAKSKDRLARA